MCNYHDYKLGKSQQPVKHLKWLHSSPPDEPPPRTQMLQNTEYIYRCKIFPGSNTEAFRLKSLHNTRNKNKGTTQNI